MVVYTIPIVKPGSIEVEAERIVSSFFFCEYRGNLFWILIQCSVNIQSFLPTLLFTSY